MPLHPFVVDMMASARSAGRPALSAGSPGQARRLVAEGRASLGVGPALEAVTDMMLPARSAGVPVRFYQVSRVEARGLIVHVHGGGWVCGDLDDYDAFVRHLALRTDCAVLAVDYRLAPEHPFPAALHDVEDALRSARALVRTAYGRDLPLIVAGDSAGANLATVALAELRGVVQASLQCLFYPVTDTDMERPSYHLHAEGLPLTREDMRWFLRHYADPAEVRNPRISPMRNQDLSGCAPAWIAVAEYDVLHDEGVAYGNHLASFGVPVEVVRAEGLAHGFVRLLDVLPAANVVVDAAVTRIRATCLARGAFDAYAGASA